jgi:hypothetical protein
MLMAQRERLNPPSLRKSLGSRLPRAYYIDRESPHDLHREPMG